MDLNEQKFIVFTLNILSVFQLDIINQVIHLEYPLHVFSLEPDLIFMTLATHLHFIYVSCVVCKLFLFLELQDRRCVSGSVRIAFLRFGQEVVYESCFDEDLGSQV